MPRRRKSVAPLDRVQVLREEIEALRREVRMMKQPGPLAMHVDDHTEAVDPVQGQLGVSYPGRHGRANHTSGLTFYHNGRWQNINTTPNYLVKVFADDETVVTGDKAFVWPIPEDVDQYQLWYVEAACTDGANSGVVQVDLFNMTQAVALLSTKIEINSGEHHSHGSTPLPVVNLANSQVDWMDLIRIDVDSAGSGRKGLAVNFVFM